MYKLPEDRFYATYFEGDEQLGLARHEQMLMTLPYASEEFPRFNSMNLDYVLIQHLLYVWLGLAPDEEARQLWLKYLPPERVLPGKASHAQMRTPPTCYCCNLRL